MKHTVESVVFYHEVCQADGRGGFLLPEDFWQALTPEQHARLQAPGNGLEGEPPRTVQRHNNVEGRESLLPGAGEDQGTRGNHPL